MTDLPTTDDISVVIPTYCREQVLVNTIRSLLEQDSPAGEIIVVDQSPRHEPVVEERLKQWDHDSDIHWLRLEEPSIPEP